METLKKLGFILHPLNKKIPIIHGWQNMTESYPYIEEHISSGGNVGLVCGKSSNVTVIDLDSFLFAEDIFGKGINTLKSCRTEGRGHVYFKYNPDIPPSKHHYLGIEVLSDGGNIVLPPSLHYKKDGTLSGDAYKWKDISIPIATMTVEMTSRMLSLFNIETDLKQYLSKCRTCIRNILQRNHEGKLLSMHGAVGREYMLAICTDLKNAGAQQEHILMFAKLIYKDTFDAARTLKEWYAINASMTWTCDKMRAKFPEYLDAKQCNQCDSRKAIYTKKTICVSDAMGGQNCSACPYHPSNLKSNINTGETNMIEQRKQSPISLSGARNEYRHKLRNVEMMSSQITILENFSFNSVLRSEKKISKAGNPYEIALIKVSVDGIDGDIELHRDDMVKIFRKLPSDLPTYKGYVLVLESGVWNAYPPTLQGQTNESNIPPAHVDQRDEMARRLQGMVQLNDVHGKGLSAKDVLIYAQLVSPTDALGLISYTKTKGLISEQDGIYMAV